MTKPKPLTVWVTTNCGKFLEMGIADHLTYLLRNLHAGQEATVRTRQGTTNMVLNWERSASRLYNGKSKRVPEKIYFCFIDYAKPFDCVDHNKLWKILRDGNTRLCVPEKLVEWVFRLLDFFRN